MVAIFAALLTGATVAGTAYLGHRFQLAHFHIFGILPFGAFAIGAGAVIGVVLAMRLTSSYDTTGFRLLGQLAGTSAYCAVLLTDFSTLVVPVGNRTLPAVQVMGVVGYLRLLIDQEAVMLASVLPASFQIPPSLNPWVGGVQLFIEVVGTLVATGWSISLLTGVPFCWRSRRFYDLKEIMESADSDGFREWEQAVFERRPIEARSIFARVRQAGIKRGDKAWVRVVVHQCPVCLNSRIRIEQRHRVLGLVRTDPAREIDLDARGSAVVMY